MRHQPETNLMHAASDNAYKRAKQKMFRSQHRGIAALILGLSLAAWWKQGFTTALLGGLALYIVLMLSVMASNYFENRSRSAGE